ncbi:MAG TPA: histidine kinase [Candidatus Limnocylindrales bacterium]
MTVRGALEALTYNPLRFTRSRWPWRSLAYLLASAVPAALAAGAVWLISRWLDPLGVALACLTLIVLLTPAVTAFERWRIGLVDRDPLRGRTVPFWWQVSNAFVISYALWWIDLGVVLLSLGLPAMLLTAPLQPSGTGPVSSSLLFGAGLVLISIAAYPITAWAGARAAMTRSILCPDDAGEVRRSRARLVDAFEVERRRIERDLHDGAQQRLVALSMNLGVAKLTLEPGSEAHKAVEAAHEQARLALQEVRELIRGVHPQVLAGRGLSAAVQDAAGRSPIPIEVELTVPRLPEAIEANAYYVVAEALANIAKHSKAKRGWVTGTYDGRTLRLEVGDDGVGGAILKDRSGVADRVATLDGVLRLSSPAGGPTRLAVEIPCA